MRQKKRTLKMFAKFGELLEDLDRNAEVVDDCQMSNGHQVPYVKVKGNIGANLSFAGTKYEKGVAYRGIEIREHLYPGDNRMLVGGLTIYDNENQPKEKSNIIVLCGTPKATTTYQDLVQRKRYKVEDSSVEIAHHADESEEEMMEVIDNLFSAISKSKEKEKQQKLSKLKMKTQAAEQSQNHGREM